MKKLLLTYVILSSNFLLLSSEHDIEYMKNTCHRTYHGYLLSTDEERKNCRQCDFSRFETYDKVAQRYIASIAYDPSECEINFLSVDEDIEEKGLEKNLQKRLLKICVQYIIVKKFFYLASGLLTNFGKN